MNPELVARVAKEHAQALQNRIDVEIIYLLTLRVLGDDRLEGDIQREARRLGDSEIRVRIRELQSSLESGRVVG